MTVNRRPLLMTRTIPNKEDFQKIGFEEKENDPVIIITNKEENDNNRNENHHGVYQDDNDENQFQKKLVVKKGWIATDKFNRVYGVYQIVIGTIMFSVFALILEELVGFFIYIGFKGLPSLQSLGVGVAKTTDPAIFLVWVY
ncbi:4275_t:CDS:2 [Entrophospora sp. SA101]|nr:4275_t:CDS:2 [Entrophospora sp. SA101]